MSLKKIFASTERKKIWLGFLGILILSVLAAMINWPSDKDYKVSRFKVFDAVKFHFGLDLQGGTQLVYNADTSQVPMADRAAALEGVRDVIERRVNVFGVSEPLVQTNKVGSDWRVIVELPGIEDVNQAIKMIGETPLLEFKEEDLQLTPREVSQQEKDDIAKYNEEAQKKAEDILKKALEPNADFAALAKEYSEDEGSKTTGGELDWFGKGKMVKEFEDVVFNLKKGEIAPNVVKSSFGYHIIKKTDERELNNNGQKEVEIRASHILITTKSELPFQETMGWKNTNLSGKNLKNASVEFDQTTGEPHVALEFDEQGKTLFGEITERNVGKQVAIFLDNQPISIPMVNEAIKQGKAVITGKFDFQEAKLLVQRLNAGALPVPVTLISQQNVGPTLGKIYLEKSLIAGLIAFILVALFMIVYYRLPGLLSVVALGIYSLLMLSLFKLIPITLTLAGIAGFILSIGMAVDANVLIFARMKEERRSGKPLELVVNEGFKRAWPSIRDGNVSSLITCFVLYWFGTSVIKGFGLTLGVGVLMSMFSAITISRTLLKLVSRGRMKNWHWLWG